jgi:hypothetical protein
VVLLTVLGPSVGPAAADTPGTTVNATPNTNLNAVQNVSLTGSGFAPNQTVTIQQAIQLDPYEQVSQTSATFTANASGAFGPVNFTVSRTFTTSGAQQVTCSSSQPCSVLAASNGSPFQTDHASISFLSSPPTTGTCDRLLAQRAAVNAQLTALINALPANLPPAQRAQIVNQLAAVRAQANAQFAAALAAASCPPAP